MPVLQKWRSHGLSKCCKFVICSSFRASWTQNIQIGHCHRHESMQILLLPPGVDTSTFEPGLASRLLDKKPLTRKIVNEANYGCSHCVKVGEDDATGKGGVRPMTGNGLRSHIKAKWVVNCFHWIQALPSFVYILSILLAYFAWSR